MRWRWLAVMLAAVLCAGCFEVGFAQSTNSGDISGTVTDTSGAAVPGVIVTVLNKNTGVSKNYVTNDAGVYDTSSIVAGTYELTFTKQGFQKFQRSSITIAVGNTTVNAQLSLGAVTQEVVVSTDVPLLKTENGEQTTTLEAEALSQLPEVGQDWSSFDILLPGAAGSPGPMAAQGALGTGTSNGTMLAVNGNLPFSTVLADGAETTLPASANSDIYTQETIQEVQISASAFSAQYGVGGIMYNQISKGGSDSFHGSAYEYFQNDALNAPSYFSKKKTYLRYDNFGGSIGGPILRQKLFFYFNYDRTTQHGGTQPVFYTVPTPAVMGGDFTGQNIIYDPSTTTLDASGVVHRTSFADEYGNGNSLRE